MTTAITNAAGYELHETLVPVERSETLRGHNYENLAMPSLTFASQKTELLAWRC